MNLARLDETFLAAARAPGLPALDPGPDGISGMTRRTFLGGLALAPLAAPAQPLVFEAPGVDEQLNGPRPQSVPQLQLGEIPADFWQRPRTLRLYRESTKEHVSVTYWRDGQLDATGYWKACAVLRDVQANRMTAMDPLVLDVLRGMLGYYEAWQWPYPLVIRSGFRTAETNRKLVATEGAAKNSLHLYGKAVDLNVPGIKIQDVGRLAQHFQRGGVGFYPNKLFVHVDTGRIRTWKG